MKTAIGGTWLIGLVMIFMLIFVSYLAVSINYSRAFQLNSQVISIMERQQGHCRARDIIPEHLLAQGYNLRVRSCGRWGRGYPKDDEPGYLYCLSGPFRINTYNASGNPLTGTNAPPRGYFRVTLFFRFDLPIIGNIITFPVSSRTRPIYHVCCDNEGPEFEWCRH